MAFPDHIDIVVLPEKIAEMSLFHHMNE